MRITMKVTHALLPLLFLLSFVSTASAEIQSKEIEYDDNGVKLKGYLYYDDAVSGKQPGVMVVHEWWGLNDYARNRAKMLAEMGYVAFAADMYGDSKVTTHGNDAKQWMSQITANIDNWQKRAMLGLDQLKSQPQVDADKLAAIGYCFGGATVMQMAYTGTADLKAVVSFHGSLPPAPESTKDKIKSHILVAHGAADGFVPEEKVKAFTASLDAASADWEMNIYSKARHAFTNPDAGSFGIENLKYDAEADKRSWQSMRDFLSRSFSGE
jgi:dienelactone hydrolase